MPLCWACRRWNRELRQRMIGTSRYRHDFFVYTYFGRITCFSQYYIFPSRLYSWV